MKLSALTIEYDGAGAREGRLDERVRSALAKARDRGVAVVMMSTRTVDELVHVSGGLDRADAFVCEDGAVVAFPGRGSFSLAPPASVPLLRALEREGIAFVAGTCAIAVPAADAGRALALLKSLQLPRAIHFNRGGAIILPRGVSKANGLREVLREFRLSSHNALAIGYGEDDQEVLDLCEVGAAVEWGSGSLRAASDDVIPGTGPSDVAPYIERVVESMTLPQPRAVRRTVTLGAGTGGRAIVLGVRGRNVLVAGDPRSGKSWAVGLVCEQLIVSGYSLCIIDPEGDYATLESLPGVVVFGGAYALPAHHEVVRSLHYPDLSVVVDLSRISHSAKIDYLRALLPALVRFRGSSGLPHRIVIDEAHYFLDRADVREFIDFELGGYTLVTYRVSDLDRQILAAVDAVIMTHTSDQREVAVLARVAGADNNALLAALLADLAIDEAAVVRTTSGEPQVERFRLAHRRTEHVRHRAKYRDVPLPADRAFVFTRGGRAFGAPVRTLRAFVAAAKSAPDDVVRSHAARGDFSRWIAEVFGDVPLAVDLQEVERRPRQEVSDLKVALIAAISLRYDVTPDTRESPA